MIDGRPYPPIELVELQNLGDCDKFVTDEKCASWIIETFVKDGPLSNPDHAHLRDANIAVLWTNSENSRNMRRVVGQAEIMPPMAMGKWQKARATQQILDWFGEMPNFLITLDAVALSDTDDASFCAVIEHELYHCGQSRDEFGMPKFRKDGTPSFAIKGHDVEEFVGVVARYGADASGVSEMVDAANKGPIIGRATIAGICGTCSLKVA